MQAVASQNEQLPVLRVGALLAARAVTLFLCLAGITVALSSSGAVFQERLLGLFTPVGILLAITGASALWIRMGKVRSPRAFACAQLVTDLALVTGIVYVTGGPLSPFLVLYLALVMAAAVLLSRTAALITAFSAIGTYLALVWSMQTGWIKPFDGSRIVETPSSGIILQVAGLLSGMVLIAIATSYLVRAIRSRDQLVLKSRRELVELSERQRNLLHNIPEAIITTDERGKVLGTNAAAATLLGITEDQAKNKNIQEVIKSLSGDTSLALKIDLNAEQLPSGEFSFEESSSHTKVSVSYYARPFDTNGSGDSDRPSGFIFVFQDVTKLRSIEEQLDLQDRMARLLASNEEEEPSPRPRRLPEFVGQSSVMKKVFTLIERVAKSDATVMINGESGTGKELVAKSIHLESAREDKAFIAVNCGAIPEHLLESEFFGHKKGSFTGAHADHAGFFQRASGGTLFLDEIGELPVHMQAKLLRALQEKTVRPVGGERDISIDVRVLAATNRNLKTEIEQGNFREDLYYRLNVISVNLPPLRDRRDDVPLLVDSILKRLTKRTESDKEQGDVIGRKIPVVPPQTMQLLSHYTYPGNVRELENILERAFVLGGSVILPEHLPEVVRDQQGAPVDIAPVRAETQIIIDEDISFPVDLETILATIERRYLESALLKTGGAKKKAAELLGINFRSFRYRLQKFDIADTEP